MPEATSAKALREKRAPLVKELRRQADAVNAENRDFNATEKEAWEKVNADYNALTSQIERIERVEALESDQAKAIGDPVIKGAGGFADPRKGKRVGHQDAENIEAARAQALGAWCSAQVGQQLTEEQQEACQAVGLNPNSRELVMPLYSTADANRLKERFTSVHPSQAQRNTMDFRATLGTGSGTAGAYLIPPETLMRNLEINLLYYGGMRQVAESIRTSTGERLSWPTADDTTNTGAQLGESASIGSSVDPTFAKVYWDAYKFSSKPVLVPYELLQDSVFDLPGTLGNLLGIRLGRITNTKYTTGTGAATPKGVTNCTSVGVTTASATAIAADELIGLVHSIDPAYRVQGCGFMMHDSILLALRKLKDGMGQYLWQAGLQMGIPDRLLSYPITINQDMQSSVASATKTMIFGLLSYYKIRTVGDIRMYRLQERYRDTDQDAFIAFLREDGNMLTAGTAPIKHLLQAT